MIHDLLHVTNTIPSKLVLISDRSLHEKPQKDLHHPLRTELSFESSVDHEVVRVRGNCFLTHTIHNHPPVAIARAMFRSLVTPILRP